MRHTHAPPKVTRNMKLQGTKRSPDSNLRSIDFRVSKTKFFQP